VYFPDRVVPMLPEVLSNGLCSLNPQVDRLCMTAELLIDAAGVTQRSRFYAAVMRSQARLTYDQVGAMLAGDAELVERHAGLMPHLRQLHDLYRALHRARETRGAIDFETTETKFRFDDQRKIAEIVAVVRHDAHRLIEECMLAANEASALYLQRKKMPSLYRVHAPPGVEKLTALREFLAELGLSLAGGDKPSARDYASLLSEVKGRPDGHMIETVLLRSMMQAQYSAENLGHFGLAMEAYTHFTSPIRRYPDLLVHRAIKHLLKKKSPALSDYADADLTLLAEHSSMTERRADEATRDVEDVLKCEFMQERVGEAFSGIVTGVNGFGLFVELNGVFVTGLVHVTALDHDYFHFDPVGHRLTGERTGRVYRLGDPIRVQIAAVHLEDRQIDLALVDKIRERPEKKSGGRSRSRRR
jgi:ribonuclease R